MNKFRVIPVNLDVTRSNRQITIQGIRQGDNLSYQLQIHLLNKGKPIKLSNYDTAAATMFVVKADEKFIIGDTNIINDVICYDLTAQDTAVAGISIYQLELNLQTKNDDGTYKTETLVAPQFQIQINVSEQINVVESVNDFQQYTNAIIATKNLIGIGSQLQKDVVERQLISDMVINDSSTTQLSKTHYPSMFYLNQNFYNNGEVKDLIDESIQLLESRVDENLTAKANTTDVDAALALKVNLSDLFNVEPEPSKNLVSIADGSQTVSGVTATVNGNKITVSGISTATTSIYLPIKRTVTLTAGLPYCLSLQNFSTNNTGIVVYPCNGNSVLGSWLLSEVSALKNSVATYTPSENITVDTIRLSIAADRTVDNSFNIQIEEGSTATVYTDPDAFSNVAIKDEYYGDYVKNKADKATTLAGYGITDAVSTDLFDFTETKNLADIADTTILSLGINVNSSNNTIMLSGKTTATGYIYLQLKKPIDIVAGKSYMLSLQNFVTENRGCVIYPCNGETIISSSWMLSESAALKGNTCKFMATENATVNAICLHCAIGNTVDNSFNIQIEEGSTATGYIKPVVATIKKSYIVSDSGTKMNYLYVSNSYDENTEGFGETYFRTILDANNSISDNDYHNRYTIIVAPGTYTDLQDKYAGMSDVGLVGYRGVMTKDYVYYESENIYNPAATVIKWDGATGFDTLKSEDIIKKCPFHLDLNVHTHIKGFTFDCKNIRYGIHLESGGTGYATNWVVSNCIFKWGGRADCADYVDKTTVPVLGCGHSFGEVGLIENCKIIPTHCTVGYQNHDNADNSGFGLPIRTGANITIRNCDFGGTEIQVRTIKGEYADTPNVLNIDGCVNIFEVKELYDSTAATKCDWTVNIANSKIGNEEANA